MRLCIRRCPDLNNGGRSSNLLPHLATKVWQPPVGMSCTLTWRTFQPCPTVSPPRTLGSWAEVHHTHLVWTLGACTLGVGALELVVGLAPHPHHQLHTMARQSMLPPQCLDPCPLVATLGACKTTLLTTPQPGQVPEVVLGARGTNVSLQLPSPTCRCYAWVEVVGPL